MLVPAFIFILAATVLYVIYKNDKEAQKNKSIVGELWFMVALMKIAPLFLFLADFYVSYNLTTFVADALLAQIGVYLVPNMMATTMGLLGHYIGDSAYADSIIAKRGASDTDLSVTDIRVNPKLKLQEKVLFWPIVTFLNVISKTDWLPDKYLEVTKVSTAKGIRSKITGVSSLFLMGSYTIYTVLLIVLLLVTTGSIEAEFDLFFIKGHKPDLYLQMTESLQAMGKPLTVPNYKTEFKLIFKPPSATDNWMHIMMQFESILLDIVYGKWYSIMMFMFSAIGITTGGIPEKSKEDAPKPGLSGSLTIKKGTYTLRRDLNGDPIFESHIQNFGNPLKFAEDIVLKDLASYELESKVKTLLETLTKPFAQISNNTASVVKSEAEQLIHLGLLIYGYGIEFNLDSTQDNLISKTFDIFAQNTGFTTEFTAKMKGANTPGQKFAYIMMGRSFKTKHVAYGNFSSVVQKL